MKKMSLYDQGLQMPMVHQILLTNLRPESTKQLKFPTMDQFGDLYKLWEFEEITSLLELSFDAEVKDAFTNLKPYAYKADLARYCILYQFGGIYLDLSVTDFKPFAVLDRDLIAFSDGYDGESSWNVANGLFYAKKGLGILSKCISQIVRHSQSHYYGRTPLSPTGPGLFGRQIANSADDYNLEIGQYEWRYYAKNRFILPRVGCVAKGKRRILSRSNTLRHFTRGIPEGNDYTSMWNKNDIYNC
jgi:hypothetical protein